MLCFVSVILRKYYRNKYYKDKDKSYFLKWKREITKGKRN